MTVIRTKSTFYQIIFISCIVSILYLSVGVSIAQETNPNMWVRAKKINTSEDFRISRPVVQIIYKNVGDVRAGFSLPNKIETFYKIDLFVDGKSPETIISGLKSSDMGRIKLKGKVLDPGETHELKIDITKIYNIPTSWHIMKIIPVEQLNGYRGELTIIRKNGPIVIENNPTVFELKKLQDVNVVMSMTAPEVQNKDFNVKLTFENKSDRTFTIPFPSRKEVPSFRGIKMKVDGNQLPYEKKKEEDDLSFTDSIKIKPGQTKKQTIDLSQIFEIPDTWKSINIQVSRFHEALDKVDEISIKRMKKESGKKEKKKEK